MTIARTSFVSAPADRCIRQTDVVVGLLLCGCVNGYMFPVLEWLRGTSSEGLGALPVNLLDLIVIVIAVQLLRAPSEELAARHSAARLGWKDVTAAALFCLPSGAAAWLATGGYALSCAQRSSQQVRLGCVLFAGLAAVQLWNTVFIKWFAIHLGLADAVMTKTALSLVRDGVERAGNVVSSPNGHAVVLFAGCLTASIIPRLLLVQAAVYFAIGLRDPVRLAIGLAWIAALAMVANILRLTLMAASADWHELLHGAVGVSLFELGMVAMVLLLNPDHREEP